MNEKWAKRYERIEQVTDKALNLIAEFPYSAVVVIVVVVSVLMWAMW